jgi:hypothetical protein
MVNVDWDKIQRHKWAQAKPPSHWPPGVRPISLEGTGLFGIHEATGHLYWDGAEIEIRQTISLRWYELALATVAALAVVASAVADWLSIASSRGP